MTPQAVIDMGQKKIVVPDKGTRVYRIPVYYGDWCDKATGERVMPAFGCTEYHRTDERDEDGRVVYR